MVIDTQCGELSDACDNVSFWSVHSQTTWLWRARSALTSPSKVDSSVRRDRRCLPSDKLHRHQNVYQNRVACHALLLIKYYFIQRYILDGFNHEIIRIYPQYSLHVVHLCYGR
jgi:hypothetical protein